MDERQTQIKEGAGLEETRINQDLVDFLNKWSSPFLFLLLIVVAGFWAYKWWHGYQLKRVNEAFATYELTIAGGSPNPDALTQVADDYAGVRAVPALANLRKADIYLRAATVGLEPGATPDAQTGAYAESDVLDDATRASYLESAASLYAGVADTAEADERWVIAVNASFGLAAARASLGHADQAQAALDRAKGDAERGGYTEFTPLADAWRATILPEGEFKLFTQADLPTPPGAEDGATDETGDAADTGDQTEPNGDADADVTPAPEDNTPDTADDAPAGDEPASDTPVETPTGDAGEPTDQP